MPPGGRTLRPGTRPGLPTRSASARPPGFAPAPTLPLAAIVLATILLAVVGPLPSELRAQASTPAAPDTPAATAVDTLHPVLEGASLLALALLLDPGVRLGLGDAEGTVPDGARAIGGWWGDWERSAPWAAGAVLVGGTLAGGLGGTADGLAVIAGVLAAGAAAETVNRAVGRQRPSWERGALAFDPFEGHASMPSGHATYTFAIAGGVDAVTDGPWPVLAYGLAGVTALSRALEDQHWLSDVAVGAAVGTAVSRLTARRVSRLLRTGAPEPAGAGSSGPVVRPLLAPPLLGLQVPLRF